jgi:hypothetical protein
MFMRTDLFGLQPDLDQAVDRFGAIQFPALLNNF